jgi:hypothetical protein
MKKLFMTLVAAVMAVSASAQVYVGGTFSVDGHKEKAKAANNIEVTTDNTTYEFLPEIGYNIDKDLALGVAFGWQGATKGGAKAFEINPYARLTFVHSKYVNVFVDGGVGYKNYYSNQDGESFYIGLKPGLSVNLNKNFSFVTKVGFFGWSKTNDYNARTRTTDLGAKLDGNNIQFGVYYNF